MEEERWVPRIPPPEKFVYRLRRSDQHLKDMRVAQMVGNCPCCFNYSQMLAIGWFSA